jgi:hypothetical protein
MEGKLGLLSHRVLWMINPPTHYIVLLLDAPLHSGMSLAEYFGGGLGANFRYPSLHITFIPEGLSRKPGKACDRRASKNPFLLLAVVELNLRSGFRGQQPTTNLGAFSTALDH